MTVNCRCQLNWIKEYLENWYRIILGSGCGGVSRGDCHMKLSRLSVGRSTLNECRHHPIGWSLKWNINAQRKLFSGTYLSSVPEHKNIGSLALKLQGLHQHPSLLCLVLRLLALGWQLRHWLPWFWRLLRLVCLDWAMLQSCQGLQLADDLSWDFSAP